MKNEGLIMLHLIRMKMKVKNKSNTSSKLEVFPFCHVIIKKKLKAKYVIQSFGISLMEKYRAIQILKHFKIKIELNTNIKKKKKMIILVKISIFQILRANPPGNRHFYC